MLHHYLRLSLLAVLGAGAGLTAQSANYATFGSGCGGSGQCTILPKAYATKFGQTANTFPQARANMRYQQVFLGKEIGGGKVWFEVCLRLDERFGGPAQTQQIELYYGQTKFDHTSITTNFANNYNGVLKRVKVFDGGLNLPQHSGGGKLTSFSVCMKSRRPMVWTPIPGNNLILEFINKSVTSRSHFEDFCFNAADCTTTRVYAFNKNATTATSRFVRQGLIVCLKGAGGGPVLGNTGLPKLGGSFTVGMTNAAANKVSVLWLGVRQSTALPPSMPGCTLYASLLAILGARTSSATGTATLGLRIPNLNALLGLKFANQWWVIDAAANTVGISLSSGGEATIGT